MSPFLWLQYLLLASKSYVLYLCSQCNSMTGKIQAATALANSTSIQEIFTRTLETVRRLVFSKFLADSTTALKFTAMFKRRAFLHWFVRSH